MTSLKGALGWLLSVFACLFELLLSLFLLGVGIIAWASGETNLNMAMLPWEGAALRRIVPMVGMVGLAAVLLAGSRLRWISPLWCLFVLVMLVRGFFLSSYSFGGAAGFQLALGLTLGALLAFLGSLRMLWRKPAHR